MSVAIGHILQTHIYLYLHFAYIPCSFIVAGWAGKMAESRETVEQDAEADDAEVLEEVTDNAPPAATQVQSQPQHQQSLPR